MGDIISAGTETVVCNSCYTPTGITINQVTAPHPIWTNAQGNEIILLDAVQMGGMFGLNS